MKQITRINHIGLRVRDQLASHNIAITETVELPGGAVFFFIRDPDDNVIEFHHPAS